MDHSSMVLVHIPGHSEDRVPYWHQNDTSLCIHLDNKGGIVAKGSTRSIALEDSSQRRPDLTKAADADNKPSLERLGFIKKLQHFEAVKCPRRLMFRM